MNIHHFGAMRARTCDKCGQTQYVFEDREPLKVNDRVVLHGRIVKIEPDGSMVVDLDANHTYHPVALNNKCIVERT